MCAGAFPLYRHTSLQLNSNCRTRADALRRWRPDPARPTKIATMLDILLLRKDLDSAIARLETRKKPQAFLNVEAFQALESERKTLQTRTEELQASAISCPSRSAC